MRYLLLSSDMTAVPFHLLYGLIELGVDINWCGDWSAYLHPIPSFLRQKKVDGKIALERAYKGYYDIVIGCDRCPIIKSARGIRILIDSLDEPAISINHLLNVDLYFKCQLPIDTDKILLTDGNGRYVEHPYQPELAEIFSKHFNKVKAFPYSTFLQMNPRAEPNPSRDIFFVGWDSPASNRRAIVETLRRGQKSGLFSFVGGVYERPELCKSNPPSSVRHPKIQPISLYDSLCRDFKINIAPRSNGQLSFRLYELLAQGCFVMAEELGVRILPKDPIDGKHLVFFKSDLSNLLDLCTYYLREDSLRRNIARNGYSFYWENLTPEEIAKYFLSIVGEKYADI